MQDRHAPLETSDISLTDLRACLQHLGDASFLAAHPLASLLGYRPGLNGRSTFREALVRAVEAIRPAETGLGRTRAWWRYQALAKRYIEGEEVQAVCDVLSVSQREFYRLLREGLEAVAILLQQQAPARADANLFEAIVDPVEGFFGRRKELDRLIGEFEALERRQDGRAMAVQGAPGIGKSRLIDEFGRLVRRRGGLYLKGHMFEDAREPYDAWIEALAPALAVVPVEEKRALQARYPGFFSLFPNSIPPEKLSNSELLDEAELQKDFYEGVVRLLDTLGSHRPVVLALDDLHWAPALTLFSHIVRRSRALRLFVLATIRECQSLDRPRVYDEIQSLVRARHLSVLELGPLSRAETATLISSRLGATVSDRLINTIFERTLGNPFFTEELVRAMWERGDVEQSNGEWDHIDRAIPAIPATVTAVIEERVSRLSAGLREVLSTASVLGERFHEGLLALMLDMSHSEMTDALEDALTLGLIIEEFVLGEDGYRFTDPLVREVLYNAIPAATRRAQHLRARYALEQFYAEDIERHTQELARHFHLAGKLAEGAAQAFRSGEKAEKVFAWATAIKWYEMALSLWDQAGAPLRSQAQACLKLGKLYCQSSLDAAEGIRLLNRALTAFQSLGERQHTAMAHLELARVQMAGFDLNQINLENAVSHLNAARAMLEQLPTTSGLAQVYLGLYTAHSRLGEFDEGNFAWVEKAKETSAELENPEVVADSMISTAAFVLISKGDAPRGLEMFEEAWDIASRECLAEQADRCRQTAALIFGITLKDPATGLAWIKRQPDYGTRWLTLQSQLITIYTLLGEFAKARDASEELTLSLAKAGRPAFGPSPCDQGLFLWRSGEWEDALRLLTEGLAWTKEHRQHLSSIRTATVRGGLLLDMGRLDEAEVDLQWAYDTARNHSSVLNVIRTAPGLCELYVAQERLANAAVLLEQHRALANQLAPYGGVAADFLLASGRYYAARGDWRRAEDEFRAALDLNIRFALPWDEAQVAFKWALSLPEPSSVRADLLDRAKRIWERIGASRYVDLLNN